MSSKSRPLAPSRALPATVTDLASQRIGKPTVSLTDEVEQVLLSPLYDDHRFRALRDALEPKDAVEGNLINDDVIASQMVRTMGIEMKLPLLSAKEDESDGEGFDPNRFRAKLDKISAALRRAEGRFNANRKQRAQAAS